MTTQTVLTAQGPLTYSVIHLDDILISGASYDEALEELYSYMGGDGEYRVIDSEGNTTDIH